MNSTSTLGRVTAIHTLRQVLGDAGGIAHQPGSSSLPDLVVVDPAKGLLAIDVVDESSPDEDRSVILNRKVAALRSAVPEVARVNITRQIIDVAVGHTQAGTLSWPSALQGRWLAELPDRSVEDEAVAALATVLAPRMVVDLPQRSAMTDETQSDRAARRVVLDGAQSSLSTRSVADVLHITGPPGSGKSLVLAARALWLAQNHPGWRIQLLCFNRMLVPYLESLVSRSDTISVSTFGKFAHAEGYAVSFSDEAKAARDVARHLPIAQANPTLDAVLIDEWQDFFPAWTALTAALLRPGRGGLVLAGDANQALYREPGVASIPGHEIEQVHLGVSYRSTPQILQTTAAMHPDSPPFEAPEELGGQPVDLVWAHNAEQQAEAVARDTLLLLQGEREPQAVGILVTRKFQIGKIASKLADAGVPLRVIYSNQAESLDLAEPTVKVMTVHSAKGLEFDVVFLVGLEHLPDPDGTPDVQRQGRTGLVGATRAKDQLVLTYSKDNVYLERIRTLPTTTLRRWVWPDDYPET